MDHRSTVPWKEINFFDIFDFGEPKHGQNVIDIFVNSCEHWWMFIVWFVRASWFPLVLNYDCSFTFISDTQLWGSVGNDRTALRACKAIYGYYKHPFFSSKSNGWSDCFSYHKMHLEMPAKMTSNCTKTSQELYICRRCSIKLLKSYHVFQVFIKKHYNYVFFNITRVI